MPIDSIYILQALEAFDLQLSKISCCYQCERLCCTSNIDPGSKWSLEIGYVIQKQLQYGMPVKTARAQPKGDKKQRGENKQLQL